MCIGQPWMEGVEDVCAGAKHTKHTQRKHSVPNRQFRVSCHKRQFLMKSDVACPKQATALVNQLNHVATATVLYFSPLFLSNSPVFSPSTSHTSPAYYSPCLHLSSRFPHQLNSWPCKTPALRAQRSQGRKWHRTYLFCSI